jgi:hypothetical protein
MNKDYRLGSDGNILNNDEVNPPDANGMKKFVILYAPSYNDAAAASIQAIGGYVAKSCPARPFSWDDLGIREEPRNSLKDQRMAARPGTPEGQKKEQLGA